MWLFVVVVLCRRDMTFPACGGRLTQQKPRTYHRKLNQNQIDDLAILTEMYKACTLLL